MRAHGRTSSRRVRSFSGAGRTFSRTVGLRAVRRAGLAVALLSLALPLFPQESAATRGALAEIVETRDRCAEYAGIAKRELKGDRLVKARGLYIEAYSSNSAWVASVKAAIREGTAKHLDTDKVYERVSSKAAAASKEFAEYVQAQTATGPTTTAGGAGVAGVAGAKGGAAGTVGYGAPVSPVLILASPLADIGIKVWKAHRDKVTAERQSASEGFAKDAAWKAWEDVGGSKP